jgi:gluconolactonase
MENQEKVGPADCPLLEEGAALTRVNREDFGFTEGPTNDRQGNIFFVDLKQNWIVRYDTSSRECETWARDTEGSNGACFLLDGRLVSCRGVACDVVIWASNGTVAKVIASAFDGRPFNGPNDLAINRSGWIYFTDPNFDQRNHHPESVYAVSPCGEVTRIDDGITRPNGIILTPDEKTLIINGTTQRELIAYDIDVDGSVSNRQVFAEVRDPNRKTYPGYPEKWFGCDGMAIDVEGNLFVTCGAGVEVFNAKGQSIGVITTPEKPTNACFGGTGNRTLFITAQKSLYAVRCKVPGTIFQQAS